MAFSDARDSAAEERAAAMELAAIVSNAARLGIPDWRVTTALDVTAAQRAAIDDVRRDEAPPGEAASSRR